MTRVLLGLIALGFAAIEAPQPAYAVACAAGVYHAGCVGPNGAAVVRRPVATPHCYWRAGVRVCR
jgi:hypothetical protein